MRKVILTAMVLIVYAVLLSSCGAGAGERMERPDFLDAVISEEFPERFVAISAGGTHNMLLAEGGIIWAWGANGAGRIGDGTTVLRRIPVEVLEIENVVAVSAGYSRSMAVTADGTLWGWGADSNGFLGIGSEEPRLPNNPLPLFIMDNIVAVSVGNQRAMAITANGELWGWGSNTGGRLGDGSDTDKTVPVFIMGNVTYVAVGQSHALVIRPDGGLYSWGLNRRGQLGVAGEDMPEGEPHRVMDNVIYVSTDSNGEHTAAITADGSLWVWGRNTHGQVGDGTTVDRDLPVHVMDNVIAVSAGASHTAAITRDYQLWVWGGNENGQVGNGANANSYYPVHIKDSVVAVATGGRHTIALTSDNSIWSWGSNAAGQLGDGRSEYSNIPVRIDRVL